MNFTDYQKLAVVTKKPWDTQNEDLADCALGLNSEAGELANMIKHHIRGAKPFYDEDGNLKEEFAEKLKYEIGDTMWYIASLCDCMGFDIGEIAEMNIAKLRKRHGDKYSGYGKR